MLTYGKDYEYVRNELDFPRITALNAYHKQYPPSHVGIQRLCRILEAFMGIEGSPSSDNGGEEDEDDLVTDLNNFPQG